MIDRRRFLLGAGGAVALPLLASTMPRTGRASTSPFPKRFITFYRPNGTNPSLWFPTPGASERDFSLGPIHQPLRPHRDRLIVLKGINMDVCALGPGEQHQQGMGALLTGREILAGPFLGGDGTRAGWANGRSIDQHMADTLCAGLPMRSLELAVRTLGDDVQHRLSYQGPENPIAPLDDPRAVFDRMFSNEGAAGLGDVSVLDAVMAQYRSVRQRVSVEDATRLDEHFSLVRELEQRLAAQASMSCDAPVVPGEIDPNDEANIATISRLQLDLLIMAMKCDLTRVGSFMLSGSLNHVRYPFIESMYEGHSLSHSSMSDETRQGEWMRRQVWHMEQLAYLLDGLAAVPEGDGTMLDHTLVFVCSEIAVGPTHSHRDMPFILAGGAGGALDTGRYVQLADRQHNDLLVTMLNAMGFEESSYGHPDFNRGPIAGLLV